MISKAQSPKLWAFSGEGFADSGAWLVGEGLDGMASWLGPSIVTSSETRNPETRAPKPLNPNLNAKPLNSIATKSFRICFSRRGRVALSRSGKPERVPERQGLQGSFKGYYKGSFKGCYNGSFEGIFCKCLKR